MVIDCGNQEFLESELRKRGLPMQGFFCWFPCPIHRRKLLAQGWKLEGFFLSLVDDHIGPKNMKDEFL